MNTFNDNLELEMLKSQMSVLKRHLSNEAIISDEMLNATIRVQVESLSVKKCQYLVKAVLALALTAFFSFEYSGELSTFFIALLGCTGLYYAILYFVRYKRNDHENLMGGSLTETARNVISWRKRNKIQGLISSLILATYIPAFFIEFWGDISANIGLTIAVVVFVALVINRAIRWYIKDRKVSNEILTQIAEVSE